MKSKSGGATAIVSSIISSLCYLFCVIGICYCCCRRSRPVQPQHGMVVQGTTFGHPVPMNVHDSHNVSHLGPSHQQMGVFQSNAPSYGMHHHEQSRLTFGQPPAPQPFVPPFQSISMNNQPSNPQTFAVPPPTFSAPPPIFGDSYPETNHPPLPPGFTNSAK